MIAIGLFWIPVVWADLNDGLVAYYPFNGNANDESGNGNHGTVHGATLTRDRFWNADSAYHFDGINDYIYGDIIDTGQNISVFVWVKSKDIFTENEYRRIFFNGYHYNADYPFWSISGFGHPSGSIGTFGVGFETNSGYTTQAFSYISPPRIDDGEWYFIGMTKKSNECPKLYFNGEEIEKIYEVHGEKNCSDSVYNSNEKFSIGTTLRDSSHEFYGSVWKGRIDDIRIYNRALSNSEIQQLYQTTNQ